jgi:hypothetical protein
MTMENANSGSEPGARTSPKTFWSGVDAKFLVVTAAGIGTLLGPIAAVVSGQYKLRLDAMAAEHAQRLDFIDKLVKAQQLTDESQRVLARLDVLELLKGSLPSDDAMKVFVSSELHRTQQQYDALLKLQLARQDLPSSASSPCPATSTSVAPKPETPAAEAAVRAAQRRVSEQLLLPTPTRIPAPELLLTAQPPRACQAFSASAPGSSLPPAQLEATCRSSDGGQDDWQAREGNAIVLCHCRKR